MKYFAAFIIAIFIFLGGSYFGYHQKKCDCETCSTDTVFVPGDTFVFENPKPSKSYPVVKPFFTTKSDSAKIDHLPDVRNMIDPCDSIRVYEYSDSAVMIIDSIQGVLLQQTIIHKPAAQIVKMIRKDSLIVKSGLYFGGSAGLNSIRIEAELIDKKGWSYSAGYDLINKSPVLGIKRKLF